MTLVSRVTAAVRANARPWSVAPVAIVIEAWAMMVPRNVVPVPIVAELPICQNTLQADAPLISTTLLFDAVVNAESTWKMNTAAGSPCPLSVSVPVSWAAPIR
ncbi:hypothetical protein SAMN05443287_10950 [Micromonospora phaseoli]|uniref:Uncharacterized protein n=1 Tax=Micromonospora phaseoli TaxID=1144548 RepID=A0A1H7CBL7_9ACTN|nr:hypothetical protein CLV64_105204 [Micromonospora phaseoli]SEJ87081.1 hypothetical protein SAMN05443287_10950 [Micromonospora phaseoli]